MQTHVRACHAAFALLFAAMLFPATAQAQEQPLASTPESTSLAAPLHAPAPALVTHSQIETSVSLGVAAQLTATRQTRDVQALDPSATVLGTVRQSFRPWLGYSANFGYTRTTEENSYEYPCCTATPTRFPIPNNVYELSLAYLVEKHVTPKLTGFADLGGGVLTFLPVHRGSTAANFIPKGYGTVPSVLFRQLGVAGVGVDYHFNSRLALRAEYRGLLYKYPDYGNAVGRAVTVSSQPTVSLTYTFGKKREGARPLVH